MAQADGVVSNASGAAVRQDINNQIEAAFTNQSGATAPASTFPCQFYADTTNDILKIRDKTSSSTYYPLRELSGKVILPSGSATAPAIYFDGETNTGLYEYANDIIGLSVNGSAYGVIGRTLENQTNAFVIGAAATPTLSPLCMADPRERPSSRRPWSWFPSVSLSTLSPRDTRERLLARSACGSIPAT